ncbi:MAG: membrane protein insertase YidC [Acidobacteria bacterium]|nr:membrane protein insertase YidC [Acidobacteriota bacterium]
MNRDFLLAIALSFLVLLASRYFLEPHLQPEPSAPTADADVEPASPAQEPAPVPVAVLPGMPRERSEPGVPRTRKAVNEQEYSVETDLYRLSVSNRGAVVKEWVLKRYLDANGEPLNLIDTADSPQGVFPLALTVDSAPDAAAILRTALFSSESPENIDLSRGGASTGRLRLQFAEGGVEVVKTLAFRSGSYEVEVHCEVSVDGRPVDYFLLWQGGFGDATLKNTWAERQLFYRDQEAIERMDSGDLASKQEMEGRFRFLGVEDHYFAAVFLPVVPSGLQQIQMALDSGPSAEDAEAASLRAGVYSAASDGRFKLFVGPKDSEVLPEELRELINYGWFAFLCKPLFVGLKWIYDAVGNYGVSIILLTIVINAALFPLRYKSVTASQKMQKIQPRIKAIQEKYKKLKPTDPKRQQMNSEVMALYKEHGVNPLGGCLPLLLQMPFLFAFYSLLNVAIELRQAPFFAWIQDLSAPDPTYVLPVLMVGSMMLTQKLTPMPSADPLQAKMMLFMPLIFGFMMATQSSGLVLYWFTSNLVNIVQQLAMNRFGPGAAAKQEAGGGKNAAKVEQTKPETKAVTRRSKRRKVRSAR